MSNYADRLALVDAAWQTQLTPEDLKLLADVRNLPHYRPLKQVLLRLQGKAMAQLERTDQSMDHLRQAQGALSASRELLEFLENEAPAAYEKHQQEQADRAKRNRD